MTSLTLIGSLCSTRFANTVIINTQNELQILLGGVSRHIDTVDLRSNCVYSGEYHEDHPTIKNFWSVFENELSDEEQRNLVKFVTSCSRPPLLGFKELSPKFTITSAGDNENRLRKF